MSFLIIFWILFFLFVPALVIYLCEKIKFFGKIGGILTLYFIGIIVANLFIFPFPKMAEALFPIQDALTSVTIPLAMPLILFSCNFKRLPVRSATLSLIFGILAMLIIVVTGYYIFAPLSGAADFNKIAGMLVGVYTGGTPNLAALKMMLGVDEPTYLLVNSFDMLVSFIYLVFLMSFGIKLVRMILPFKMKEDVIKRPKPGKGIIAESNLRYQKNADGSGAAELDQQLYHKIFTKKNFLPTLGSFGLSVLIAGISIGVSFLITGKIDMLTLILTLTTLAIGASFIPKVRRAEKSYDAGMYLVLIFSLVVASMVNIREINFSEGIWFLAYIAFSIFGSLIIQLILARIFKIDADTTIITSVALINSPLFVPMIADCMKNKKAIIIGITIGVIGYAAGNYLGVIVSNLV